MSSDRLTRLRAAVAEAGLDGLYIAGPVDDVFGRHSANRRYVSGFTGSTGQVVVTRERALIAVDSRYWEQAERECEPRGFEVFRAKGARAAWVRELFGEAGLLGGGRRLGISRSDLSYGGYVELQGVVEAMAEGERPELVPAPPLVEELRKRKEDGEMGALLEAIRIADRAYERVADGLAAGQTEVEVALAVEAAVRMEGGEGVSFQTIVAAGPWAAMPHAQPRAERMGSGQMVVIDMGALADGYCSDLTRTTVLGGEDSRFRAIYEVVYAAQRNAIERVEVGMTGADADRLARSVIEEAGYGERFGHGLGHGVGLEVHESPWLGGSSQDVLEEGMVFTIEPGIYLPGWGGIRIEDVVRLENGKARVLSSARKLIPAGAGS